VDATPGYWKNHLDRWPEAGYSPDADFGATFGVYYFHTPVFVRRSA
jgi:hypothetical protein